MRGKQNVIVIERRKAWRLLQSRVGRVNTDYELQNRLLNLFDGGELDEQKFFNDMPALLAELGAAAEA